MRAFDNWTPIYDNVNKPLYGRISFFKLHTTELLPIYNEDGTVPLQNPMPTSQYGLTDVQVFLQDKDYTIKVEKWIGAGAMTLDDPNAEDWEDVRTFDNLYPAILINSPDGVASIVEVATINALRAVDVAQGTLVNYARVLGYNELGDMPPQYYKLTETSDQTIQDDGGSVIRPEESTSFIWQLIPQENIDVRVFGIFPSQSTTVVSQTSNIHNCFVYANKIGKDVYFPQVYDTTSYYFLEGGTHNLRQKLVVDRGAHIVAKPLTTTSLNLNEIQYYGSQLFMSTGSFGQLTINCPEVKTSWKSNSWANWPGTVDTIIVDSLNSSFSFYNAKVKFVGEISGNKTLYFEKCMIEANEKIKNCTVTFKDCGEVSDRWLSTGNTVTLLDNLVYLENFKSANTYIEWKNKQLDPVYGDLGEQTIEGVELRAGAVAENAFFKNVTVNGSTELHNVSGNIIPNGASVNLNAIDCWLTITGANVVFSAIQLRRGRLAGLNVQVLTTLFLDNVDMDLLTLTTLGATAIVRNSSINGKIVATDIELINNQIYAEVDQRDVDSVITVKCIGNMFHSNNNVPARHYVHTMNANTVVNGMWANNGSSYDTVHWIRLDRTNLKIQDNDHKYCYMNNSEPYLQKYSGRNHPMRFPLYAGSRFQGRGIFETTNIPFAFINKLTKEIFVVPRSIEWKAFTVGRGYLARSGEVRCSWNQGIFEDDYNEHTTGDITGIYTWGSSLVVSNQYVNNGERTGYGMMISRDTDGEAQYNVSFESATADHTTSEFSNGVLIGYIDRDPYDGWNENFAIYPASPMSVFNIFVYMDNNFISGATTPQNYPSS